MWRVNDVDKLQADSVLSSHGADALAIAQQDRGHSAQPNQAGRRLKNAQVLALGENNPLGMAAELINQGTNDWIFCVGLVENVGHRKSGACSVPVL
jgi:hypothetical protein